MSSTLLAEKRIGSIINMLGVEMKTKMNYLRIIYIATSISICTFFTYGEAEISNVVAGNERLPGTNFWLGTPVNGYNKKRSQTFIATQSGYVQSVSFSSTRTADTTAPLRIRIADTFDGMPNSTLGEAYISSSEIPLVMYSKTINTTAEFIFTTSLYLEEGTLYALVFDATEPEADYVIWGTDHYPYLDGEGLFWNNCTSWTDAISVTDDLYFRVHAFPPISPVSINKLTVLTNDLVQLTWTNGLGEIWIDQSINLRDWNLLVGPLTNVYSWSGAVEESSQRFFRIRSEF